MREDLAAKEEAEIVVLQEHLPQMLSEAETEGIVDETIASTGAASKKDMGKVMKEIMAAHKGRVDGRIVQAILGRKLTYEAVRRSPSSEDPVPVPGFFNRPTCAKNQGSARTPPGGSSPS